MSNYGATDTGKGHPRPVDRKKWDAWWDEYEANKKTRIACVFGKTCRKTCSSECLIGEVIEATK